MPFWKFRWTNHQHVVGIFVTQHLLRSSSGLVTSLTVGVFLQTLIESMQSKRLAALVTADQLWFFVESLLAQIRHSCNCNSSLLRYWNEVHSCTGKHQRGNVVLEQWGSFLWRRHTRPWWSMHGECGWQVWPTLLVNWPASVWESMDSSATTNAPLKTNAAISRVTFHKCGVVRACVFFQYSNIRYGFRAAAVGRPWARCFR